MSGRELAMARRKAMSGSGKKALAQASGSQQPTRTRSAPPPAAPAPSAVPLPASSKTKSRSKSVPAVTPAVSGARAASLARRKALSTRGKVAVQSKDRVRDEGTRAKAAAAAPRAEEEKKSCGCKTRRDTDTAAATSTSAPKPPARSKRAKDHSAKLAGASMNPTRAASLARRRAQSTRGKAAANGGGMSAAQTVRSANPDLSSRDLAKALREQRSKRGGAGQKKSAPTGRQRPKPSATTGAAEDQPWKVGAGKTSHGQTVTGTQVGRSRSVTGDEASTCRSVTGTEYLGADIFRDFCQSEPAKGIVRVGTSATSRGNAVSGNKVGRSQKVTGDEPGTCKRVTGTEYVGSEQAEAYCEAKPNAGPAKFSRGETRKGKTVTGNLDLRSERVTGNETGANRALTGTQYTQLGEGGAPAKVGASTTLRGGSVTGTMVGRREKMTGDEPGSCRNITGDDYVGQEQYNDFCLAVPGPTDRKVRLSKTMSGETVTGTLTGRSGRVTGDEPGTCKAVTGTPYAGAEQYSAFCETPQVQNATARMHASKRVLGAPMTGIQPSIKGKMTGDDKGACEAVSGTPYVGADQIAAACPATPAEANSPDFPQPLGERPWGQFSTSGPNHASTAPAAGGGITGTGYEKGQITGPFGMAAGKVTGTEEARFGRNQAPMTVPEEQPQIDGRVKSRITGEGVDAGPKITGDDWDRGDRVTGTEGASSQRRNPTRRGGAMNAMAQQRMSTRNEDVPEPVSKVTGSSGNTEKGALITYSGGARG